MKTSKWSLVLSPVFGLVLAVGASIRCDAAVVAVGPDDPDGVVKAVQAAQPGDTVELRAGVYRNQQICLKTSGTADHYITITAADGANVTIKGSTVLKDGWTQPDAGKPIYRHAWPHAFGRFTASANDRKADARGKARDQLFINGQPMIQVASADDLAEGTFHIDRDAKTLDLWLPNGVDPAGQLIEASSTDQPLLTTDGQSYIRIQNIRFEHGANAPQDAALVQVRGGEHCILDHVTVQYAAGAGVSISGESHVIRDCRFNHNGQLGIHSSRAVNCRFERCEIAFNDTLPQKQYNPGWEGGGSKISRSHGVVFDGVYAHDNFGSGIWFDIDNHDAVIVNCVSHDNVHGIHYEISYSALIANNICYNNRLVGNRPESPSGLGIFLSSSAGCRVVNNTVFGNDNFGILLSGALRGDGAQGKVFCHSNQIINNIIADNQQGNKYGKSFMLMCDGDWRADMKAMAEADPNIKPNQSDYNLFWLSDHRPFFVGPGSQRPDSLASWQQLSGMDAHSIWQNPQFVDPTCGDFHLKPASSAMGKGCEVPDIQPWRADRGVNIGAVPVTSVSSH